MKKKKKALAKASPKTVPPRTKQTELTQQAKRIYKQLVVLYPDAHCALNYRNAFELLIATILSAQCTDVRVNMVTPALFKKYPNAKALAKAKREDVEKMIHSTGFFRNKTKSIQGASEHIDKDHGGHVPDTMAQLLKLPGVARKTANVVLGNAFGKSEGVVVDTHVSRLTQRMGLAAQNEPVKIEQELMALFGKRTWTRLSHLLIAHGRGVCSARKPQCDTCTLAKHCKQKGVR